MHSRGILSRRLIALLAVGCALVVDLTIAPPAQAAEEPPKPFTQSIPGIDGVTFDMVPIPAGKFLLGSPATEKLRKPDEGPQVEVAIEPFYMGKTEVTWDLYNEFIGTYSKLGSRKIVPVPADKIADAVSYPSPIYEVEAGPMLERMGGRKGKYPAVSLSHYSAKQFCKWLSYKTGRFYRLPTEAEWEYAARAGTNTAYFFGDDPKKLDEYAWYADNSQLKDGDPSYHLVGQKKPNPWGLYDIYGNVAEIVQDQYEPERYKFLSEKALQEKKPVIVADAIRWPDKLYPRLGRGGGYESDADQCRSAGRQKLTVVINRLDTEQPKGIYWWTEGFSVGFRLVSPVKEPTEAEKHKFWDVDSHDILQVLIKDKADRQILQLVDEIKPTTKPASKQYQR